MVLFYKNDKKKAKGYYSIYKDVLINKIVPSVISTLPVYLQEGKKVFNLSEV